MTNQMTKPIEGWVVINNDNNGEANRYTSEQVGGDYIEVFTSEEGALDVSGEGETVRPVRITFTDTTAQDLINDYEDDGESTFKQLEKMHDYVESLAPELNGYIELEEGQKIQNALKKERERIYEKLADCDWDTWEEIADDKKLREFIFGEEK